MFRRILSAVAVAALFSSAVFAGDPLPERRVMTWVPAYAVPRSQKMLNKLFHGAGPKLALTHLGLQLWTPTASGGLARLDNEGIIVSGSSDFTARMDASNAQIQSLVTYAHTNGIKVSLCVFNGVTTWDWPLAKSAFDTNRTAFVTALINEMNNATLDLDGIDIDFEGNDVSTAGEFNGDKTAFVQFISDLATQVHSANKNLSVDTFPFIYNAPNSDWWADLLPHVDALNSMGYEDIGRKAATGDNAWRSYATQKTLAGAAFAKLSIGMPSNRGAWRGNSALQQIKWVLNEGSMGVAIWDAQLPSSLWRTASLWRYLAAIRDDHTP